MSGRGVDRAVTVQIGAVLLLAIVVSALAMYQVNAVPEQNYETEFDHNERVTGELVELRDAIRTTGADRTDRGVSLTLGTQYQSRVATINPPQPAGRIATSDPLPVSFENTSTDDGDVQTILDDPPDTRLLTYEPRYNEYEGPTTSIEHTLLYDAFADGSVTLEEQTAFRDDRVTLVFVDGDLSRASSGTVSVSVESLSGPTRSTTLESDDTGNVTVTLPTRAPERWEDSLGTTFGEESGAAHARVRASEDDSVTVELADEEYELRLAQVSVGSGATADERIENATATDGGSGDGGSGDGGSGDDPVDRTVYGVADAALGNNEGIEYAFDLETDEGTYAFDVHLQDSPGGGAAGGNWETKRVTVDGNLLELTSAAADDIGADLNRRDLLDPGSYEGGDTAALESIRESIDGESQITNEQDRGGNAELVVEIDDR